MGQHHARVYSSLPEAELVAVADPRVDRAKDVAARFHCESFRSHEEMTDRVDAVSVAAPTPDHASIGMDFLRQGKHVLLEKPMTQTVSEADDLIEIQLRSSCVLQVGHSERFKFGPEGDTASGDSSSVLRGTSIGGLYTSKSGYRRGPGSDDSRPRLGPPPGGCAGR